MKLSSSSKTVFLTYVVSSPATFWSDSGWSVFTTKGYNGGPVQSRLAAFAFEGMDLKTGFTMEKPKITEGLGYLFMQVSPSEEEVKPWGS